MDVGNDGQFVWRTLIPSGTKNSRGIDVVEDRRGIKWLVSVLTQIQSR